MKLILLLTMLAACGDKREVTVYGPFGQRVEVHTNKLSPDGRSAEISVTINPPSDIVPVLTVPAPFGYRSGCTAEKPLTPESDGTTTSNP